MPSATRQTSCSRRSIHALHLRDGDRGHPRLESGAGTTAQLGVDRSGVDAVYKGFAIAQTASGHRLYATDFHNKRVDVFDGSWGLVRIPASSTRVQHDYGPSDPGRRLADLRELREREATGDDEQHGQGLGFVDVFDTSGTLLGRVAQRGQLEAPGGSRGSCELRPLRWRLACRQFRRRQINAYAELSNGHFEHRGELPSADGRSLTIDGLWALEVGNGAAAGPTDSLFFTFGPEDESHGLFGSITPGG